MYGSRSRSESNTYTEARARYVNSKVYDDTQAMALRNLITQKNAQDWRKDIQYILNKQAMSYFQFQFHLPNGTKKALQYNLKDNGLIYSDDTSGGVSYWEFPKETRVTLLVNLDFKSPNYKEVNQKLKDDGWGNGSAITGSKQHDRSYSKDGYGFDRNKINW